MAAALGAVQFVSSIALRAGAQPGSWVRLVPAPVADRVEQLDPVLPMPPALRLVLARRAAAEGDPARAEAYLARLPASPDKLSLEGILADERGDTAAAVQAFLAAGDLEDIERRVEALNRAGSISTALALQREVVARLAADPTQPDALAKAYFALGRLEETQAYHLAVGSAERGRHEALAGAAYARAVALAPLEEGYLIAYGSQLLNLKRIDEAATVFVRARDVDPTSIAPLIGLAVTAEQRGDVRSARAYLEKARALDPHDTAATQLERELGR